MTHLGIIAALPAEARCIQPRLDTFKSVIRINAHVSLIVSGMGYENAQNATRLLIENNADYLLSWGTAAALHSSLKSGDIILANQILDHQGQSYPLTASTELFRNELIEQCQLINACVCQKPLVHTETFLNSEQDKLGLFQTSQAWAADMESYAIYKFAKEHDVKVGVARVITDKLQQTVPSSLNNHIDEFGRPEFPGFYQNLLSSPGDILQLIRLASGFRKACNSLRLLAKLLK